MIHVGIDLHQKESQICVIEGTGEVLAERRVPTRRDSLQQALAAWGGAQVLVEACNESEWVARHLERCGRAKAEAVVQRLQSVPQVGPITALAYVAALDDVHRFRSAHQVESYLGMVPRERSSGEHQVRGRITKTGDKHVRWLLVEAGWRILRSRKASVAPLQAWTDKIAARRGRSVAVVAVARRLAGILYAMWRDGADFNPMKLERRHEPAGVC